MLPMHRASRRVIRQALVMALVGIVVLGAFATMAEACPQCKKALASSDGGMQGNIVRGYFWSILFMLSMPFLLLGSFCTYMYLEVRKARRKLAAANSAAAEQSAPDVLDDAADRFMPANQATSARDRETVEV